MTKKSASTRNKSGMKQTQACSKKQSIKKPLMKFKMKAVIPIKSQDKTVPKEPKKVKVIWKQKKKHHLKQRYVMIQLT